MANASRTRALAALVLGVLIFFEPFFTGARSEYGSLTSSNYAVGVLVVVLSAICLWAAGSNLRALGWLEGLNALLGAWTIVTPFVFASDTNDVYANVILGILLVVAAGWDSYVGFTSREGGMTRRGRAV